MRADFLPLSVFTLPYRQERIVSFRGKQQKRIQRVAFQRTDQLIAGLQTGRCAFACLIGTQADLLEIAVPADRYNNTLVCDHAGAVDYQFGHFILKLGPAGIAVFLTDCLEFLGDDMIHHVRVVENCLCLFDLIGKFRKLCPQLCDIRIGQTVKTQCDNCLRLRFIKSEFLHQVLLCVTLVLGLADDRNDLIKNGYSLHQTFNDMTARFHLRQFIAGTASDDFLAEINKRIKQSKQSDLNRALVNNRDVVVVVVDLQIRVLVEVVQDHIGIAVLADIRNDAQTFAVGFITDVKNTVNILAETNLIHLFDKV